jgi:hypothetical protein
LVVRDFVFAVLSPPNSERAEVVANRHPCG